MANENKASEITPFTPSEENVVVYRTEDSTLELDVQLKDETVWLSLNQMAMLFGRDKSVISRHIKAIFQEGELAYEASVAKNATVQMEGDRQVIRYVEYYNLNVIISVGYRVKSQRGTLFRIWATKVLKDYLLRGYAANQRLLALEERVDRRFVKIENTLAEHQEKSDFRPITEKEKNDYLALFGFTQVSQHSYTNGHYELRDTHNQNVVIASDGTVAVIDAVIKWAPGEHYRLRTKTDIILDEKNEEFLDKLFEQQLKNLEIQK